MADLEADVDDPDGEDWDDEEHEDDLARHETSHSNVVHSIPESNGEDIDIAASTTRLLSIRNGVDEPPLSPQTGSPEASTILTRRNARRISPPQGSLTNGPPFSPPSSAITSEQNVAFGHYLRPITPTQPLMPDEHSGHEGGSSAEQLSTPHASEILVTDGPMTPTNNAGPFVFDGDGSSGRVA